MDSIPDSHIIREVTDSRTLYICGPPGVGKTATLNHVLNFPEIRDKADILFFNAMHYKDTKEFMNALDEILCKQSGQKHVPSNSINTLVFSIQNNLKILDTFRLVSSL